jgi:hypothetical protein
MMFHHHSLNLRSLHERNQQFLFFVEVGTDFPPPSGQKRIPGLMGTIAVCGRCGTQIACHPQSNEMIP